MSLAISSGTTGMSLEPGQRIAERYRLERRIGVGGMGEVWAASHLVTEKRVAMKFVSTSLRLTPLLRERLFREAKAAGRVKHPGVIEVVDAFALEDDVPVLVMELLEGESLASRLLRDEVLELEDAAGIMLQAVSAVGAAHACGIVHRDLKPDNVFLCEHPDGPRVKILDFGVAKLAAPGETSSGLTSLGQVLGTPAYMSPEQCRGDRDVDHRADMWAIGVMLYEVLSGERPVEGTTVGEVVEYLLTEGVPPLRQLAPEVPFDVAVAARRLLERKPQRRGEDLREVADVLAKHATVDVEAFGPATVQPTPVEQEAQSVRRMTVTEALHPTESRSLEPSQGDAPPPQKRSWGLWAAGLMVLAGLIGWQTLSTSSTAPAATQSPSSEGQPPPRTSESGTRSDPGAKPAATTPVVPTPLPSAVESAAQPKPRPTAPPPAKPRPKAPPIPNPTPKAPPVAEPSAPLPAPPKPTTAPTLTPQPW